MIKVRHQTMIIISGSVWFAIGLMLMILGLNFLLEGIEKSRLSDLYSLPLLNSLSPYLGGLEEAALMLIAASLFIGHMKGRYVLGKSAIRGIERIKSFPNPTQLTNIYSAKYYILIAIMIGLGMSMKFLGLSNDIRGGVDVAIGAALLSGSMLYFREAFTTNTKEKN